MLATRCVCPINGGPTHSRHQRDNLEVFGFDLDATDMATIAAMNEEYPYYWDPTPTIYNVAVKPTTATANGL